MMMENIRQLIAKLDLIPHREEGGYFKETYRSGYSLASAQLPGTYTGARSLSTAIYYLLTADTCSRMHRLPGDEIFHFYGGDPVEMLLLKPDGSGEVKIIGGDVLSGQSPQVLVPGGTWQGAHLRHGGEYALMGTTMAPGFDQADFESGSCEQLSRDYPDFTALIGTLTAG
jgi:uncharacterized protein